MSGIGSVSGKKKVLDGDQGCRDAASRSRKLARQVQSIINREDLGELCLFPQVSAAVSAYIDGDLAGFRLIGFRHLYFEYAIAIIGANRIRLHGLR